MVVFAVSMACALAFFGIYAAGAICLALLMILLLLIRQDELAAVVVIIVHLYVDWYLALRVVAPVLAALLLCCFFLLRSSHYPWAELRAPFLWLCFLCLTIIPAIQGGITLYDRLFYYPNIIAGAMLMFWLGSVVGRSLVSVKHVFQWLAFFAALIAIHTIIQGKSGVFLLSWSHMDAYIADHKNYYLPGNPHVIRPGSFFIDPDWSSSFFAITLFLPLSLLVKCISWRARVLYLVEIVLLVIALLFTYSTGAVLAAGAGALTFFSLGVAPRYRWRMILGLFLGLLALVLLLPEDIALFLHHATDAGNLNLRLGVWHTALRVITAFPLSGIGLGLYAYLQRAEGFRVPAQFLPLAQPHNSYLELAAMAGLPVLVIFLVLLCWFLAHAWMIWQRAVGRDRTLLAGGISLVVALTFSSLSINAWTLPPLSAIGWLLLGCISSPLLSDLHRVDMEG
ncbi:MAG TPA: O-antigen ligase family protein [Ktedonobacteraceae bacterium]|nr:O-antigen ligase family protein [Ktedonobacteraceae bacterium]